MVRRRGALFLRVILRHRPIRSKRTHNRRIQRRPVRHNRRILHGKPATPATGCGAIKICLPPNNRELYTATLDFSICPRRSNSDWSNG